jgi:hypothetical protein
MLDLTITPSTQATTTASACDSYLWSVNGTTYNASGMYTVVNGCDTQMLDLTISPIDSSVTLSGNTLTANDITSTYQWVDCDANNAPIQGETNQSFTPTVNGNYAVNLSFNDCMVTSNCTAITSLGLQPITSKGILMYPNPTSGIFYVDSVNIKLSNITIFDSLGRMIMEVKPTDFKTAINLGQFAYGIYIVKMTQDNKQIIKKLHLQKN